jgi:alpha-mannosidase
VIPAGYALNAPLDVRSTTPHAGSLPPSASFVSTDGPGFVVETVKRADDGDGDIVVRGYEAFGGRHRVRLRVGLPFTSAARADLLERQRHEVEVDGDKDGDQDGDVLFDVRPFELVTLRLERARSA